MTRPKKKQNGDAALSLTRKVDALSIKDNVNASCRTEKTSAPNGKKRGKENVNAHSSMKEKKASAGGKTEKTLDPPSKKGRKVMTALSLQEKKATNAPTSKKKNVDALSLTTKVDASCSPMEKVDAPTKEKREKEKKVDAQSKIQNFIDTVRIVSMREVHAHSSMKEKKATAPGKMDKTVDPRSKKETKVNAPSMQEKKATDALTKKKKNVDALKLTTKVDALSIEDKVDASCRSPEKVDATNGKKQWKEKVDEQGMIHNNVNAVSMMREVNAHSSMKEKKATPRGKTEKTVDPLSEKETKVNAPSMQEKKATDALTKKKKNIDVLKLTTKVDALSIEDKVDASCRSPEKVDATNGKNQWKEKVDAQSMIQNHVNAVSMMREVNPHSSMKEKKASAQGKAKKTVDPLSKKERKVHALNMREKKETDAPSKKERKVVSALIPMTENNVNAWSIKKEVKVPRVTIKIQVNPAVLRFTQESVASYFQASTRERLSLREAMEKIKSGTMIADDFPILQVVSFNGLLWSVDNRRLWVFRMAKCSHITVKVQTKMHIRLKTVINNPSRYKKLSESTFLPKQRNTVLPLPAAATVDLQVEPQVEPLKSEVLPRVLWSQNVLPLPAAATVDLQVGPRVFMNGSRTLVELEPVKLEMAIEGSLMASTWAKATGHVKRRHFGLIILVPLVFVLKYVFTKRKQI